MTWRLASLIVSLLLMQYAVVAAIAAPTSRPTTTMPSTIRQPQYPLKDRRTLLSDDEIAQARQNVARYPAARAVADESIKLADQWLDFDDDALRFIIAPASVPRAFDVSAIGCPNCGTQITEKFGGYAWIVDPKMPFKVKCPNCGNVYPTNDFAAYYRSGFEQKVGWDTSHVDDGWGWSDPKTGEKYWFVAYANHWTIFGKLRNAVTALGRAYVLTGDKRYAHKALVALHRFAEVYPDMDHEAQSRYGSMMRALGRKYPGKIVNLIWETDMMTALAEAYDFCWDAIDGDTELQRETGKSGEQIRAFIEANLLEDAIDAYFKGQIRGNYGMHQQTLAHLAIVREHADREKLLDSLMDDAGSNFQLLGLNYALYNLFFRDGLPYETSVHYNSIWLERISQYAPLLERTGRKPFDVPKVRRMYDGALALICARAHNPAIGDGGTIWGGIIRPDLPSYQTAYRHYHDPLCGAYLAAQSATGETGFKNFDSLFHPPIDVPRPATTGPTMLPAQPPRLLDGYGMGILNNADDSIAISLYYGLKGSHGHFDRLHIDLFANGQPMLPDLGYPDAMNEFVPGIFSWSQNTIAHNTVTVDASRQKDNVPGTVELFACGRFARVMDVSAQGTYPQCDQYRRAVIMIDCGPEHSYFVDIFTISGGGEHDYSLHGPPGTFDIMGGRCSEPEPGTLAGPDVQVGQLYDDPKLGAPGYKGGYSSYTGSGFQHLYNVRRLQRGEGEWVAQWAHERDPSARLRLRILDQPGQQIILANARVSPMKYPQVLTYLIARRQQPHSPSRFVSVLEPFKREPLIESVAVLPHERGSGVALKVRLQSGSSDTIFYDPQDTGTVEVQRRNAAGEPAGRFSVGKPLRTGAVVAIDPQQSRIRVRPDDSALQPEDFIGRVIHFRNELRRTAHTITSATRDGNDIVLIASDDLLVGRARLDAVRDNELTTKTAMFLAPIYRGTTLTNARFQPLARVAEVEAGTIRPATPIAERNRPSPGQDVWLINVGPGDRFELPAMLDGPR